MPAKSKSIAPPVKHRREFFLEKHNRSRRVLSEKGVGSPTYDEGKASAFLTSV